MIILLCSDLMLWFYYLLIFNKHIINNLFNIPHYLSSGFFNIESWWMYLIFNLDPPLKFWSGLAGTAVAGAAGAIPIPGFGDAAGNFVKQGIEMLFSDHKFDTADLTKDVATGLAMGKITERLGAVTRGIRGTSKWASTNLIIFNPISTGGGGGGGRFYRGDYLCLLILDTLLKILEVFHVFFF